MSCGNTYYLNGYRYYYDRSLRLWVYYQVDEECEYSNQIGETYYDVEKPIYHIKKWTSEARKAA